MNVYYLDTSALVKLYVKEPGSLYIRQIYNASEHNIVVSAIGMVEAASALARRRRMEQISAEEQRILYARLLNDSQQRFDMHPLTDMILLIAAELTQRHPLRGYDAVHLATALELHRILTANHLPAVTFLSADDKLNAVARAEGLTVEEPDDQRIA